MNKNAPHQAIILVRMENYEREPSGKICRPSSRSSQTFTFIGRDFDEVEQKTRQFLEQIKEKYNEVENNEPQKCQGKHCSRDLQTKK